ncbi:MAG: GntR family transcriptional regulator [Anaerolineaceae bacterium]|nr:MAG: GntR family transcriptional regulator [Anaerolineaceae bacterium]
MTLHIDTKNPIPIYYQIREQLRQQIVGGQLNPGDMLPTEMEICAECGVSRMTARQALTQLANEGLVTRQRGRGTFVAAPKATLDSSQFPLQSYTELLGQIGMQAGAVVLAQVVEPASESVAAQLKLSPGDPVVRIARQRLMRGEAMSLETSFYPHSRCPDLASLNLTDQSVYRLLEEHYGIAMAYATDTIELSVAGAYEAKELKISEGVPVVLVTRLSFLEDNTPIEFTQTIHRGDRFKSVVRRSHQQLK